MERRGVYARQAVSVAVNRIGTRTDPRGIFGSDTTLILERLTYERTAWWRLRRKDWTETTPWPEVHKSITST